MTLGMTVRRGEAAGRGPYGNPAFFVEHSEVESLSASLGGIAACAIQINRVDTVNKILLSEHALL